MNGFDEHFKMKEEDAVRFIREKTDFFEEHARLGCREIGDGNINYVFRITDEDSGKSVIIKHGDKVSRTGGSQVSTDRNRIEAEILKMEGELAPGFVPQVYLYDPVMSCLVMEDLKDYENMRYELIRHRSFPGFAEHITTFMAETLLGTTDVILDAGEKKELAGRFINRDLCRVTERLVYTEPYRNLEGRNVLIPENQEFLEEMLYGDPALHLEAAKLKEAFKNKAQALLHGDLHTGSIFVKQGSTKVLDPEFAFYGPIGYDVGNVMANLIFAWANGEVTMEKGPERERFLGWLEETIEDVLDLFARKAKAVIEERHREPMADAAGFADWYVKDILEDTAGVAGLELNRRIVGSAKVKDVAGIEDRLKRTLAERICVLTAKELILHRKERFFRGADYVRVIKENGEKMRKEAGIL